MFGFTGFLKSNKIASSQPMVTANPTNIQILNTLINLNILNVLQDDLYLKTFTVLKRPVQTLPVFNLYHTDYTCQNWMLRLNLFGNKTDDAFFANDCPFINSFVNITNPNLLKFIESLPLSQLPFAQIINIFSQIKKEERRAGLMIQGLKNFNDLSLEFTIPLFYDERNYFLNSQERQQLESFFPVQGQENKDREYRKHIISDKFGFGDARIKLGYLVLNNENIAVKFGLQTTLPISFAFKKGLLGSNFTKLTKQVKPQFSFINIFDLIDTNLAELKTQAVDFAMQAADRLSAMVLDSPLGNHRHFSLGAFLEPQLRICDGLALKAISYIEYFFSANETRFFIQQKNPADFEKSKYEKIIASGNEAAAGAAIEFLDQQVIATFFPKILCAQVTPGFMFQFSIGPQIRLREWDILIGYDFWYQQKERIDFVFDAPNNLEINKATKPKAIQNKIFLKVEYNKLEPNRDWSIGVGFEHALTSKGIGRDFSATAGFTFNY